MALKLPAFINNESVKKIVAEAGLFVMTGLICSMLSITLISRYIKHSLNAGHAAAAVPAKEPVKEEGASEEKHEAAGEGHAEKPEGHGAEGEKKEANAGNSMNIELKPVIFNLAGASARRYAKITFTLQMATPKGKEIVEESSPEIYDTLIKILGNYRFEDISSGAGKEAMKEEVRMHLNLLLKSNDVSAVYITELIIQ